MNIVYRYLFLVMWLGWGLYWWGASRNVKATARKEPRLSRALHIVPLIAAAGLLWLPAIRVPWLGERFLPGSAWTFWTGALLTAAGLVFSVRARLHLGRNWSGVVTIKKAHELITTGPYALVRHPIYTGLLLGFVGSAVARGEWRGVVAVVIAVAALWRKLRLEERWMQEQFGGEYRRYSERVAALIPFVL